MTNPFKHDKRRSSRVYKTIPPEVRFWAHVRVGGPDDCWQWLGGGGPSGHGRFRISRSSGQIGPHRFSYELSYGKITKGLLICHHCDNPGCVNPRHLYAGTHADNAKDAVRRNRMKSLFRPGRDARRRYGTECHFAKITEADVCAIRSDPRPVREIAEQYAMSVDGIRRIKQRKVWKHV